MVDFDQRIEFRRNEICIVGAGPAGLSAAAHCAELNIPYVLLEAADQASNTIYKYQKGKHVMAEPQVLPLRSPLSFAAGKREAVLEAWRRAGRAMPVLILTARDRWSDKVQGFDAGADDYVAKPFHLEEVLARIRALLRRSAGHAKSELNCGSVRLDTRTGRVTVDGNPVKLTSHEYRLLSYLMHHTGRVVSRSELVEHLYDQDFDRDSNTIEVFVGRVRKKLGVDVIQTVRGLGYLLAPPGNAP